MTRSTISVHDIWQLAFPAGTTLLGGCAGLGRAVEWVSSLRATQPLFPDLREGYLAIARMSYLRGLSPQVSHHELIDGLDKVGAVALAIDEPVSPDAVALADKLALSLLLLPAGVDLHALERAILRALLDHEGQLARRETEIAAQLRQRYGAMGLQAVLDQVAHATQGEVILEDSQGAIKSSAGASHGLKDIRELSIPVDAAGRALGRLLLRIAKARQHPLDIAHGRQAAIICGLELLQQQTRRETKERLGADLVEQILDGSLGAKTVATRLSRLGYDASPGRHHLVVALGGPVQSVDEASIETAGRDLRWLAQREGAVALTLKYREDTLLLCSFAADVPERRVRGWVKEAFTVCVGKGLGVGLSRLIDGVLGLAEGIRQARGACHLGLRIAGRQGPFDYAELGLYRLLAGLRDREELVHFYEETLGPLDRYDREHNTELLRTLQVFFDHHGNASQTAKALFVHRNTLNYRLRRIGEITDLDLGDAEARLNAQVALRIHRLR